MSVPSCSRYRESRSWRESVTAWPCRQDDDLIPVADLAAMHSISDWPLQAAPHLNAHIHKTSHADIEFCDRSTQS